MKTDQDGKSGKRAPRSGKSCGRPMMMDIDMRKVTKGAQIVAHNRALLAKLKARR